MFLDDERAFYNDLPASTKEYFADGRKLHDAVLRSLGPQIQVNKAIDRRVAQTVLALLSKGLSTFRGIELVAMAGLGGDAQALLRSLFEAMLAAQWILQNEDERKQRAMTFAAYEFNQYRKMLKAVAVNKKLADVDMSKQLTIVDATLDGVLKHVPGDAWKEHWSGKGGIENVARELDALDWYDTVFRFSSSALHANMMRQLYDAGDQLGIDMGPDAEELPMALAAGMLFLRELASVVFDALGLSTAALDSV